jgi:phage tail sheath gpL-like
MDCNNITGTVNGVAKSDLCKQVLACVRMTKCASASGTFSPSDCICGTGADVSVCAGQTLDQVTGACKAIIAQGAESTLLTDVSVRLGDPAYATGLAIRLVQCDQRFCATDCPF